MLARLSTSLANCLRVHTGGEVVVELDRAGNHGVPGEPKCADDEFAAQPLHVDHRIVVEASRELHAPVGIEHAAGDGLRLVVFGTGHVEVARRVRCRSAQFGAAGLCGLCGF